MLLVKYIMQLTVSTMPVSVQNEMKRKKYDQERMRYTTLRSKKERRSGSVDVTSVDRNDRDDKGGGADKTKVIFQTSPCPPIRECAAESHSLASSQECAAEGSLVVQGSKSDGSSGELARMNDKVLNEKPTGSNRRVVNVRATTRHSPLHEQNNNVVASLGENQRLPSSHLRGYSTGRKDFGAGLPASTKNYEENVHPNFEEAISKLPRQHLSTNKTPYQGLSSKLNSTHEMIGTAPPSSARQGYASRHDMVGQGQQQRQPYEDIISPSSSLSTIPRMPTPCQLNLDSDDDDTLCTFEDDSTPAGFYKGATAPPLSPGEPNRDYGARPTISSGTSYSDECSEGDVDDGDDHTGPKAKWGVHHIAHYTKSERSMGLSEQKQKKSH
jgi:hypothetical protein